MRGSLQIEKMPCHLGPRDPTYRELHEVPSLHQSRSQGNPRPPGSFLFLSCLSLYSWRIPLLFLPSCAETRVSAHPVSSRPVFSPALPSRTSPSHSRKPYPSMSVSL